MRTATAMETLSSRGQRGIQPALPYFNRFFEGLGNVYSAENPEGYCLFAVAENKRGVFAEHFIPKIASAAGRESTFDSQTGGYGDFSGLEKTREAFAAVVNETVLKHSAVRVSPLDLLVSSGSGAVIGHLAFSLMDEGDSVLLPTPTYAALKNDFGLLAGNVIHPVPFDTTGYRLTRELLETAFSAAQSSAHKPKILMLLHPNNPLGTILSPEEMTVVLEFLLAHRELHLVSDEIYANSCWGTEALAGTSLRFVSFVEALERLAPSLADPAALESLHLRVHCIWGLSKDWAASGLRVGVLHTKNASLRSVLSNYNYFSGVSHVTQNIIASALSDIDWSKSYLRECNASLREAYSTVCATLDACGVPFVKPVVAGMFVWIDMRRFLDGAMRLARKMLEESPVATMAPRLFAITKEEHRSSLRALLAEAPGSEGEASSPPSFWREQVLVELMWLRGRLLLTPGEACMASSEGHFRLCFAWPSKEALCEGMKRLEALLREIECA